MIIFTFFAGGSTFSVADDRLASGWGKTFSLSDIEIGERRTEILATGFFVSVKSGLDVAEPAAFAAERVKSAGIVGVRVAG